MQAQTKGEMIPGIYLPLPRRRLAFRVRYIRSMTLQHSSVRVAIDICYHQMPDTHIVSLRYCSYDYQQFMLRSNLLSTHNGAHLYWYADLNEHIMIGRCFPNLGPQCHESRGHI